eukprot:305421_1
MQQNLRNTRYNVNWDCSNQYKHYTYQEKQFIEDCWKNNMSCREIAKILKRGLWAIEVQIMYIKNNNNNNSGFSTTNTTFRKQKKPQKQISAKRTNRKYKSNQYSNLKRYYKPNRKFEHAEHEKIIQTSSITMENHLSELMGL